MQTQISENAFVVWRMVNTTFMMLLSALLGSIAGILAIAGKFMASVENYFGKIKEKIKHKEEIDELKEKRKTMILYSSKNRSVDQHLDTARIIYEID